MFDGANGSLNCSNILLDMRDQTIAPPWNCLNVLRVLRIIAKRTPEARNRFVNNIVDHYRVRPDLLQQLIRHYRIRCCVNQRQQDLHSLGFYPLCTNLIDGGSDSMAAQPELGSSHHLHGFSVVLVTGFRVQT